MIDSALLFLAYMVKYPETKNIEHILAIYEELPDDEKEILRETLEEIDNIDELFVTVN